MSRNKHKRKVSKKQLCGFKSYRQLENWMVETRNKLVENSTDAERKVMELLELHNVKYRFQFPVFAGKWYFVDFFLPDIKTVIEVDGGYHDTTEQIEKDMAREKDIMKEKGWKFVRVKNSETDDVMEKLKKTVKFNKKLFPTKSVS